MVLQRMTECGLVVILACIPDYTPKIMMSLSQRLHVPADPIAALITELQVIKIQETAEPLAEHFLCYRRLDELPVVNKNKWLNVTL